ncbi:AsmA family protein [Gluconobacter morbifer]|uniref:Uncharacterized protein n=1 Tax=Gluconobacter morbifer G707 TaxID=1088869 RepID=G6XK72_9PROT|nr:AsmA-like C-terminal region-containing protein [Gluconobacter morbifer]EHH68034.1 hypothetical protein GMO_18010 [Gluconobacter morbifer G707]
MLRWFSGALFGAIVLTALALWGGWTWVGHHDFSALVVQKLSKATGRAVRVRAVHVQPGLWMDVTMDDLHIANIPGGTRPDMMSLGHLHAKLRLMSLLHGPAEVRNVTISRYSGLFERTPEHLPNWRFGATMEELHHPAPARHPAPKPDIHWMPGLRDATIDDSDVTYRTAGGASYRVGLQHVTFASTSDSAPLIMRLSGSYNDVPVAITADMQSIRHLRRIPEPYGTKAHVTSGDMTSDFDGTLTDPMNFDGVQGHVTVATPTSATLFAVAGMTAHAPMKLTMTGDFIHQGNDWHFANTRGTVQDSPIQSGIFDLLEGMHGHPDIITADLGFTTLDINSLMPVLSGSGTPRKAEASLRPETDLPLLAPLHPDPILHATLTTEQLLYNRLIFSNLKIEASQTPGRVEIPLLRLEYVGATLNAKGRIDADGNAASINAEVALAHGDIDHLRRVAELAPVPVNGTLGLRVIAQAAHVRTLNEASRKADVIAAVSMEKGEIAREIVEAASMDLRLLVRHAKGVTPITCMLGVLQLHQGVGTVAPLRIRTGEGIVAAKADFDLNRRWLDLVFASRPFSTSFFALDVPVRVSGRFDNPGLSLASWSKEGRNLLADSNALTRLPPALRGFAASNACARPTR